MQIRRKTHVTAATLLLTVFISGATPLRAQSAPSGDEKRPVKNIVQPVYPELAKKLNLTGTVKIEITIAPDGTVKRTHVIGGHPVLAYEAETAARKCTFQPGPKETTEVLEFKF